jgi:hypothetical protein
MPAAINTPFFTKAHTKLGVKPKGFPPIYQPGVVVDAILYSAEKVPREVVACSGGKGARNPPVMYHAPVLGHPRAIAKPRFGDTSGGA